MSKTNVFGTFFAITENKRLSILNLRQKTFQNLFTFRYVFDTIILLKEKGVVS